MAYSHGVTSHRVQPADEAVRPRRGRAKDRSKDIAVLDATIVLLATEGLSGLSMDRVATASGVSKVTVYNRWSSKLELLGAALTHLQVDHIPPMTGSLRSDLVAHLDAMVMQYDRVGGMAIIGNCLADEPVSGQLIARIRESTLIPRREHLKVALRASIERGELSADVDLDLVVSLLFGTLYADYVAGRTRGPGWVDSVVSLVLSGVGVQV